MIIVTRPGTTEADVDRIRERVEALGLRTHISKGEQRTIVGCIGDEERLREVPLLAMAAVECVLPVLKPYKLASREFTAGSTVVRVGNAGFGGPDFQVIAGPCAVESAEMMHTTAGAVRAAGARLLRGGAFKPRTSPYSFRGLGQQALEILADVRRTHGMPVVTEVMDTRQVELIAEHVDMLQIGARNMQNFELLSEVGRVHRPVLLKRGMSATINDLLLAAEYIMSQGNMHVVLCERGIRTFETATRNTFDVSAIPVLKRETHLPVIADPSHGGGRRDLVAPLSFAAIAAGADGLLIEVHPQPEKATSDGEQSLTLQEFATLMEGLQAFAELRGRRLAEATPAAHAALLQ
jgi:3-deoxy-7-phosphoheptulonate synthase